MEPAGGMEDYPKKKKFNWGKTNQNFELNSSMFIKSMMNINNTDTRMNNKKNADCRNASKEITTSPNFQDFEIDETDFEEKMGSLYESMLQKNYENDKKVEHLTQFLSQLTEKFKIREVALKAKNEKFFKHTQAKKIELKIIREQEAIIDKDDEIAEEKLVTKINNLENQLTVANEKSIKIQLETQQLHATEAEMEKYFHETISELETRGKIYYCKLPQIGQNFEKLKATLTDKKLSLKKFEQEEKQLDDALDDCVRTLEIDVFSKLESEITKANAKYADKIELRTANLEELARISKSLQEDVEAIQDNRSEIEKLTVELNNMKDQRNLLDRSNLEMFKQNDESSADRARTENKVAILEAYEETNDQNPLENMNLLEIQGNEKKLTPFLEEASNLENENVQIHTQLKELRQKKEANNKKLAFINTAKEETDKKIKNLNITYEAKTGQKDRIKKKLMVLYPAPPPIFEQQSAPVHPPKPKIRSAPDIPKPYIISMKKRRKVKTNWDTDSTVSDRDPNDLLNRLLKGGVGPTPKKSKQSSLDEFKNIFG